MNIKAIKSLKRTNREKQFLDNHLKFAMMTTKAHLGIDLRLQTLEILDNSRDRHGNRRCGAPTLPFPQRNERLTSFFTAVVA